MLEVSALVREVESTSNQPPTPSHLPRQHDNQKKDLEPTNTHLSSSPSDLLTTIASATSTIPFLDPCRSSPPAGGSRSKSISTVCSTST